MSSSVFHHISSTNVKVLGLILRSLIHFELIWNVRDMDLFSVFCMQILSFPATFVEETVFSPLYVLGVFVKNQMGIAGWIHV
jgi:hypothetical protein